MKKILFLFLSLFVLSSAVLFGQRVNKNYIVGSDPTNINRLPDSTEEVRKYIGENPIYAVTGSGSGKEALVELKPGFIFYNKIADAQNDNIKTFILAWCGNFNEVARFIGERGEVLKRIPVSSTILLSIKRSTEIMVSQDSVLKYLRECFIRFSKNERTLEILSDYVSSLTDTLLSMNERTKNIEETLLTYKEEKKKEVFFMSRWDWEWIPFGIAVGLFVDWLMHVFDSGSDTNDGENISGPGPDPPNGRKVLKVKIFQVQLRLYVE